MTQGEKTSCTTFNRVTSLATKRHRLLVWLRFLFPCIRCWYSGFEVVSKIYKTIPFYGKPLNNMLQHVLVKTTFQQSPKGAKLYERIIKYFLQCINNESFEICWCKYSRNVNFRVYESSQRNPMGEKCCEINDCCSFAPRRG